MTDKEKSERTMDAFNAINNGKSRWMEEYIRETGCSYTKARLKYEKAWEKALARIAPCEDMPCTICYWSDKRAAKVVQVLSPTRVAVRFVYTECVDYHAGKYKIYNSITRGDDMMFTKRGNGAWIKDGHPTKNGVHLCLHTQEHYIDPSF